MKGKTNADLRAETAYEMAARIAADNPDFTVEQCVAAGEFGARFIHGSGDIEPRGLLSIQRKKR